MNQEVSVRKNIVWNSIGTFVMFFCQWLMMVLVVRLSGYADSGILSLSISCGNVFLIIAAFGVKTYQVSDVAGKYQAGQYYAAKIFSIALTLIVAIVWALVAAYEPIEKAAILLYALYIMVYSYADAVYGELQKKWRLDIAGISLCIRNIFVLILFCVLIYVTHNILIALIVMFVASLAVLFLYDLPQTRKSAEIPVRPDFAEKTGLFLLKECFPYAIYTFLHTLVLTVPKLAVRGFYDKEVLGIYAAVMAPVTVLQVAATFVINPVSTVLAIHLDNGHFKGLFKVMLKCILMLLGFLAGGILIAIFLGKFGLRILYGESITEYSYLLVPMVIVSVMTAFTILLGNLAVVLRNHKGANLSGILGLAAVVASSLTLVKSVGLQGATLSFIIGLFVQDVVLLLSITRNIKKEREKT